jgi:hypothetical protein
MQRQQHLPNTKILRTIRDARRSRQLQQLIDQSKSNDRFEATQQPAREQRQRRKSAPSNKYHQPGQTSDTNTTPHQTKPPNMHRHHCHMNHGGTTHDTITETLQRQGHEHITATNSNTAIATTPATHHHMQTTQCRRQHCEH